MVYPRLSPFQWAFILLAAIGAYAISQPFGIVFDYIALTISPATVALLTASCAFIGSLVFAVREQERLTHRLAIAVFGAGLVAFVALVGGAIAASI